MRLSHGISTDRQRAILAAYARGQSVADLVDAGYPQKTVQSLIRDAAGWDRGRARMLVEDFDVRAARLRSATAEWTRLNEQVTKLAGERDKARSERDQLRRDLADLRTRLKVAQADARAAAEALAAAVAEAAEARAELEQQQPPADVIGEGTGVVCETCAGPLTEVVVTIRRAS